MRRIQRGFRLKKNRQFRYVYSRGKNAATREIVLIYARSSELRVGFSVSKKVDNAVVRNLLKRRMRECFRPYVSAVKPGLYIFAARTSASEASFEAIKKSMRYLLKKQGLLSGGEMNV